MHCLYVIRFNLGSCILDSKESVSQGFIGPWSQVFRESWIQSSKLLHFFSALQSRYKIRSVEQTVSLHFGPARMGFPICKEIHFTNRNYFHVRQIHFYVCSLHLHFKPPCGFVGQGWGPPCYEPGFYLASWQSGAAPSIKSNNYWLYRAGRHSWRLPATNIEASWACFVISFCFASCWISCCVWL